MEHMQLVLMPISVGGEIGPEINKDNDQFFRFEMGEGKVLINSNEYEVSDGDVIVKLIGG